MFQYYYSSVGAGYKYESNIVRGFNVKIAVAYIWTQEEGRNTKLEKTA
jgi:hypothetical protein